MIGKGKNVDPDSIATRPPGTACGQCGGTHNPLISTCGSCGEDVCGDCGWTVCRRCDSVTCSECQSETGGTCHNCGEALFD